MKENKVVPIFGAYFNGNFGDDLMAYLFAECLETKGYIPLLWGGPNYEINGKIWKSVKCVDTFLENAKCVVFGGGMVFCDSFFPEYWNSMEKIIDVCENKDIPIILVSVGSDGDFKNINPVAKRLIRSPVMKAVSLRLKSDLAFVQENTHNTEISCYQDIILTSSKIKERLSKEKVLFCITVSKWEKILMHFLILLMKRKKIKVNSISQFIDKTPNASSYYKVRNNHLENKGVDSLIEAVKESDIVIARGLHVGMFGIASGATFISYKGTYKTSSFLKEVNLVNNYIQSCSLFFKPFLFLKLYQVIKRNLTEKKITHSLSQLDAENHYHFLFRQLGKIFDKQKI